MTRKFTLPIILVTLFFFSCNDLREESLPENPVSGGNEKVSVAFDISLSLDDEISRGLLSTRDEETGNYKEIGEALNISDLIYAVYTINATTGKEEMVDLRDKEDEGSGPIYVKRINDYFTEGKKNRESKLELDLIRNKEYTLIFCAESNKSSEYFEEEDPRKVKMILGNILNNDDDRDVYCYIYKIIPFESDREITLQLRRPFAQLNIGIDIDVYNELAENGCKITESAMTVSNMAVAYDLYLDRPNDTGFTGNIEYKWNTIPFLQGDQYLVITNNENKNETEKYVWLSMSYVLPPNYSDIVETKTIDIEKLLFKCINAEGKERILTFPNDSENTLYPGIPVMRNRRTNIIVNSLFSAFVSEAPEISDNK